MCLVARNKFNNQFNCVSRIALLDKLNVANSFACPTLTGAKLTINLLRLDNFDSPRLLAAMFILTLLSGCKPYVSRFNLFQTFHEKDYDAQVAVTLNKNSAIAFMELFALNITPFLSKVDLSSYALKTKKGVVVNFTIADLSFIRVVETHSIFFK